MHNLSMTRSKINWMLKERKIKRIKAKFQTENQMIKATKRKMTRKIKMARKMSLNIIQNIRKGTQLATWMVSILLTKIE